jgi:hypothetical protein
VEGRKPQPFELRENAIIVSADAGGEAFRFLLDTGASRSVVSERLATRVGTPHPSRTLMVTPVGQVVRPSAAVWLRLGSGTPMQVIATVAVDEDLAQTGIAVDGIIGQDVLSSLVYTIDYACRVIWWAGVDTRPADRLQLEFADGRALVTIPPQQGLEQALRLIPDTGADALVLFKRRGGRLPAFTPGDVGTLRTLTGHQLVRRVVLERLQLGGATLQDHEAVVLAAGSHPVLEGDGLLPLHVFSRVTFNGPERYMAVEK